MTVEDLTLDCQSDQEDHSAEKKAHDLRLVEEANGDAVAGGIGSLGTGGGVPFYTSSSSCSLTN